MPSFDMRHPIEFHARMAEAMEHKVEEKSFPGEPCPRCLAPWEGYAYRIDNRPWVKAEQCTKCAEDERVKCNAEREDAQRKANETQAEWLWHEICPPLYRTTTEGGITEKSRVESLPEWPAIAAHKLGNKGLILRGNTGVCKSRAMFRLLRTYHDQDPRPSMVAVTAGEFDRQCRDAQGEFRLSAWFSRLASVKILFIDDLGKTKWTPSTSGQFWELVDARTKELKPLFITTNLSGDTLVEHMGLGDDIGQPLLRRLRENCVAITMKGEK